MSPAQVVPRSLDRAAAISWRLIVIGIVAYAGLQVVSRLFVIVLPIYTAMLLAVVLDPVVRPVRERTHPAIGAWAGMLTFIVLLVLSAVLVVPAIADEAGDLGTTLSEGLDDIEDWMVDSGPVEVSHADAQKFREDAADSISRLAQDNQDQLVSGAILAFEFVAGGVLTLVILFFVLKDGPRFQELALQKFSEENREGAAAVGGRIWTTLRGYMIGSATLGFLEGIVIGLAVFLVGGSLVIPVAVLTFFAAFVPFLGAIVAGFIAVLVTLVSAGPVPALIVAVVALLVQQFDNDLLAPFVFGKALDLHPLVILLSITGFSAVLGVVGTFIAVPVVASLVNGLAAWRAARPEGAPILPDA